MSGVGRRDVLYSSRAVYPFTAAGLVTHNENRIGTHGFKILKTDVYLRVFQTILFATARKSENRYNGCNKLYHGEENLLSFTLLMFIRSR